MRYNPLGDRRVSVLGLGLAALGRPGYINLGHADDLPDNYDPAHIEHHAHTVLDAAWEAGIRYFDAARSYGRGEAFLGNWLRSRNVTEVTIGSKWGYTYTADWQVEADKHEVKEHSLPVLQRQWGESQANLGHYLNIYQIHSATLESGVLENSPVLDELRRLKAEHGIMLGLSLSGAAQADTLQKALALDGLFDTVQATWNLLEQSVGESLQQAHTAGMGIIIKEVLANGRLTPRNADNPAFAAQWATLTTQAERLNTSVDALAIAAALAQPWVSLVLSGAAQIDHLRSNLRALDVVWDAEATDALAAIRETPADYWHTRSQLAWN